MKVRAAARVYHFVTGLGALNVLFGLVLFVAPAFAGDGIVDCEAQLLGAPHLVADGDPAEARRAALGSFIQAGVPVFLKTTRAGDVPVVLVNHETAPQLWWFFESSLGTQVQFQVTHTNDHGLVRVADQIIDVDTPGSRGFGEVNATGIAWKPLKTYLPRRHANSYPIVEVAYALTPAEKRAAQYYQRVRRAAIVRVPFTFGGNRSDLKLPNMLDKTSEHCFVFCKASGLRQQIAQIKAEIEAYGIADAEQFLELPEVQKYLANAQSKIMAADATNPADLMPTVATRSKDLKILKPVLPAALRKSAGRNVFANWLIGLDATSRYYRLMQTLAVSGDSGAADMNNPRVTAILIYDTIDYAQAFANGTYSKKGSAHSWDRRNQRPVGAPAAALDDAPAREPWLDEEPGFEKANGFWKRVFGGW